MSKILLTNTLLLSIIDAIPISVLLINDSGEIVFSNEKVARLLGYAENEMLGLDVQKLVPMRFQEAHKHVMKVYNAVPTNRPMNAGRMLLAVNKNGNEIPVQLGLTPIVIEGSKYVLVSMIESANKVLKTSAHNDQLTGLPNRSLFKEISSHLRELAVRNNTSLAIMFIDLDGFKAVNDRHGHSVGDQVLCDVAQVFSDNIRKNDVVGRIGGDEFVICLYGLEDSIHIERISNVLIKEIASIEGEYTQDAITGASIGVILTKTPSKFSIDEMIDKADKLMYQAKHCKKGTVCIENS